MASFRTDTQKVGYAAAKHGVMALVRVGALEGPQYGLTVNAIAPGWMETGMMGSQLEAQKAYLGMSTIEEVKVHFRAYQPGNRFIDVREVAATVGFLASPLASAVNGVCVPVDLGTMARA